jgi:hypothetical protein
LILVSIRSPEAIPSGGWWNIISEVYEEIYEINKENLIPESLKS